MTARSRGYNQYDWDPMRDDYNNSSYEAQYPDEDSNDSAQLDHNRLYITNIPIGLNDEGIHAAFAKYGNLLEIYVSKDPTKRYGLVRFETASEAKLAMMKMNLTEPLKLNISIAYKNRKRHKREERSNTNGIRGQMSNREETASVASSGRNIRRQEDQMNGDNEMEELLVEEQVCVNNLLDPMLDFELENLKLEQLKIREEQLLCKHRMLLLKQAEKRPLHPNTSSNRCILPDGRIVVRNNNERVSGSREAEVSYSTGAGDSHETTCSCKTKTKRSWAPCCSDDGSSTPSTCILCSEVQSDLKDKSEFSKSKTDYSNKIIDSRTTDVSTKKSDCSKVDTMSKKSHAASKKFEVKKIKSDCTCDLKFCDFYTDTDDEDETNRLIQLRNSDYMDIIEDDLKLVVALAGYPKSKMRLRQMELFQRCLGDVIDMQLKNGLLKKVPSFIDYYLNRGALVCVCKDVDTRDWMVRISPGLQERMCNNLVLLRAKVKRLCLAVIKIPRSCWPATAQDAFKLLQYFNPMLKTDTWKIYAQKIVADKECTSFLIDRVSGEIIRGPSFKNVIDYEQMDFELTGYTEIYYECLLSNMKEDLSSVTSRIKLLEELRSAEATPRNASKVSVRNIEQPLKEVKENVLKTDEKNEPETSQVVNHSNTVDVKKELQSSLQKEILKKLKDITYISDKDEMIVWSDKTNNYNSDPETEKIDEFQNPEDCTAKGTNNIDSTSGVTVSDKTESVIESKDNLIARDSNLNIDSNRGIAYHRRTNYLHVEHELKVAITLEGYPQNKLEGTHIRRLKHLFKEYLHKDMKLQRFTNLIIPKFQDIYLSNGAVIYICDSLETKDYLTEVLPRFINSTGLKLTFTNLKNLVRYTRIVMRLPKEHANVESVEILRKLQTVYPGIKPDCWKYYSDIAGKQKRQFGVDPDSLEVIKSLDFDPTYEGEKLTFRIIDRQKRDMSLEGSNIKDEDFENIDNKKQRDTVLKSMYAHIDLEIVNAPLTRIRTNHYSDLITDDLKLYVGPANYPESRVDEDLFHSIKRTFENIATQSIVKGELDEIPKFHDMYLFDGVIFIICQNMYSRNWTEKAVSTVNTNLYIHLKSTEFRGAVGIISMVVKTDKSTDEVINLLQDQNPRLRTKYWRKISTVRTKTKLDVVLQIDKLSAQVITNSGFNKFIGEDAVQFKLGHLQSVIKPKLSLEELRKVHMKTLEKSSMKLTKKKSKVSIQPKKKNNKEHEIKPDLNNDYSGHKLEESQPKLNNECVIHIEYDSKNKIQDKDENVFFYKTVDSDKSDLDPIIIEPDSPISNNKYSLPENQRGNHKMILKIPLNILPESKDDLNIIFDLLEDKNPGLNPELWHVYTESEYPSNGKFTLYVDRQSVSIIQSKSFDSTIGGEKLKFFY